MSAVVGAVAIEWLRARRGAAGDQALALVFYVGIAAGVVMVSAAGALDANLFTFLFGSILTVTQATSCSSRSSARRARADRATLPRLVAVAVDEESARVSGIPVEHAQRHPGRPRGRDDRRLDAHRRRAADRRADGAPGDRCLRVAWSLLSTLLIATAIGVGSVWIGLTLSYYGDLAPGGAIVLVAAGAFAVAALATSVTGRLRTG